ncbi:MAG TPA: hypothetical protein DD414_08605 [Lachnospiraceae bacterium]|nr:hypothetical protein [Lachnospiraceae bacterium]
MLYGIYLLGIIFYLVNGIGNYENRVYFMDHTTILFVLIPCVLLLICTGSLPAFARGFLFAFGKRDYPRAKCEESLQAVRMTVYAAVVSGGVCFSIGMINGCRHLAMNWSPQDGINRLLLDLSVAVLSLLYPLLICLVLLPVCFLLKNGLSGPKQTAAKEPVHAQGRISDETSPVTCAIIKELLSHYMDGLTSDETNTEIRKHLETCEACRTLYEQGSLGQ